MPEDEKPSLYRIADLAVSDRPRERLARLGAQSLTTAELLAILLRTGCRGRMPSRSASDCGTPAKG